MARNDFGKIQNRRRRKKLPMRWMKRPGDAERAILYQHHRDTQAIMRDHPVKPLQLHRRGQQAMIELRQCQRSR